MPAVSGTSSVVLGVQVPGYYKFEGVEILPVPEEENASGGGRNRRARP